MGKSKRHRSRSRSRSRSKHRHDDSELSHSSSPPKRPRTTTEDQVSLTAILKTLQEVQQDLKSTNDRVSNMENYWHRSMPVFPPKSSVEADALSVLALSDGDVPSDQEGSVTAIQPPVRANEPPTRANEPPTRANEPPTGVFEPQSKADKPSNEAQDQSHGANLPASSGDLYDPDSQKSSWEPKADFAAFLQKNFRRKLSYDQVSDVLDNYSVPSVDCLLTPALDSSILDQILPAKSRKYTQERDRELASVQKAMLNVTGPLSCLHDALTSNKDVSKEDIKTILEQSLCLLGSANCQFSTLRRKKVLVAINKEKMGLADQSLPNAKRMLFGDDFPSIASKQADLSRGLAKNLGSAPHPAKRQRPGPTRASNQGKSYTGTYGKYQSARTKNGRSFRAPKPGAKESTRS